MPVSCNSCQVGRGEGAHLFGIERSHVSWGGEGFFFLTSRRCVEAEMTENGEGAGWAALCFRQQLEGTTVKNWQLS